jgi:hypothetical protein
MKSSHLLLSSLMAGTLLCSGVVLAQAAPAAAPATAGSTAGTDSATYQTAQGTLVVNSVAAPAPSIGPAPSFATLAGGGKSITAAQAAAYPPLANDFINADRNQDGKISKSEYAHWLKQL